MDLWEGLWKRIFKDVLLTGLGMGVIARETLSAHPNGFLIGAGLALTVPSVASHVRALLPGPGDSGTSASSLSPGEQGSLPSPPSSAGDSGE